MNCQVEIIGFTVSPISVLDKRTTIHSGLDGGSKGACHSNSCRAHKAGSEVLCNHPSHTPQCRPLGCDKRKDAQKHTENPQPLQSDHRRLPKLAGNAHPGDHFRSLAPPPPPYDPMPFPPHKPHPSPPSHRSTTMGPMLRIPGPRRFPHQRAGLHACDAQDYENPQ